MKNAPIRFLIIVGALTMASIIFIQIYWVSQAVDRQEEQFNHSVQMALRSVVEALCEINGNDIPSNDPIDQLSNNYFIARTNYRIDLESLDYLLKAEFEKRNIGQDYEFGVYDCQTDRMVYGDFVSLREQKGKTTPKGELPKLVNDEYYFGVYFPGKAAGMVNSLGFWKWTSILTLIILIFFSYALFVILKQKRLSEIQRDFINNMTHEFKTPLATLQVSSDVLVKEAGSERLKRYAGIIREETDRLQKHVWQLLETSLLDHVSRPQKQERIAVLGAIQAVVERYRGIPGKVISETYDAGEPVVSGDPMLFETMMFNLIDNAVKYGKRDIGIRVEETANRVTLEISNDGGLIPAKEQKKIFKKFYRINQGNLHDVKGFGLGLYLVKSAVRLFHGSIRVHSTPSLTAFIVSIPKA